MENVTRLIDLLPANSIFVRHAVLQLLQKLSSRDLAPNSHVIVARLEDGDARVRQAALELLGALTQDELALAAGSIIERLDCADFEG